MTPIHEHGWKGERDRAKLLGMYYELAASFFFKPLADWQLAKMTNHQLDRLCRDTWDRQPSKEQRWYAEKHKMRVRSGEFAWRWFWHDLFHPPKKPKVIPTLTPAPESSIPFVGAAD